LTDAADRSSVQEEDAAMIEPVIIAGVGMIPFRKPGDGLAYPEMGAEAARAALADAGIGYEQVQQAYVGFVYGDSTSGQRALYDVGMTGIPVINVNNNCSTGSTALFLARQAVASGAADCVLALGFEQMRPGALGANWPDRPSAFERFDAIADDLTGDVCILAQAMTTDRTGTFTSGSMIELVGASMSREAAARVYEGAGIGPEDISVCELHDCFAQNEVITYEALGFCPDGGAEKFVADGGNTYGGQVVTNPSGGLLSKGHPLGATGLAQCYELTRQLRGCAGAGQVEGARLALQNNLGLGGAAVVTLYCRG